MTTPQNRKPLDAERFHQTLEEHTLTDWKIVKKLPTDYDDYGGKIERRTNGKDLDCSCGCRHFVPLAGKAGADWGICTNPAGPRAGLLTFVHQAGRGCFEGVINRVSDIDDGWYPGRASRDNMSHPGDLDYEI